MGSRTGGHEFWYKLLNMLRLRSYKSITPSYFCVQLKNRPKHSQHFELLFMINLQFATSNYLSTCGKTSLLLINSIYFVLFSLEIQKRLTDQQEIQTKYATIFFYCVWKKTTHKPSKLTIAKKFFSSVHVIVP